MSTTEAQPLALHERPVVEARRAVQMKPCQEIALIERQGLLHLRCRLRWQVARQGSDLLFQRADIQTNRCVGRKGNGLRRDQQKVAQMAAQARQDGA